MTVRDTQEPERAKALPPGQSPLAKRPIRVGFVRIGPLTGLPGLLQDLGYDPAPIFASEGLDPAQFANPDGEIAFLRASKLLARCKAVTGCDSLGLLLGGRAAPSLLGVTGFLLKAAPDVGTALRDLVEYLELQDRGAVATLTTRGALAYLGYAIHLSGTHAADQIYDLAMAIACQIMRGLCGAGWNPAEVHLSRRQPHDLEPYQRFFRAPVHFDADQSAVAFPTQWLNRPIESADPLLHRYLEQEANALRVEMKTGITSQLRKLLRATLTVDQGDAHMLAARLGLHVRTLNRRLREEGTTLRRELEEIRYEVARHLLAETSLPLSKIGAALGYADSTAFTRAFKRWAGISPAKWRQSEGNT